ncbi:MAG: hypothetical protein LUH22_17120 [Bacteroides sp.]|nr:hypothetical protein [Bacteroides sp.]
MNKTTSNDSYDEIITKKIKNFRENFINDMQHPSDLSDVQKQVIVYDILLIIMDKYFKTFNYSLEQPILTTNEYILDCEIYLMNIPIRLENILILVEDEGSKAIINKFNMLLQPITNILFSSLKEKAYRIFHCKHVEILFLESSPQYCTIRLHLTTKNKFPNIRR